MYTIIIIMNFFLKKNGGGHGGHRFQCGNVIHPIIPVHVDSLIKLFFFGKKIDTFY